MRQYEPCIQIIIIRKKNHKSKKKKEKQKWKLAVEGWRERVNREKYIYIFFSSLLSKIYENQTVGFRQSKRQSQSTHRELRMGTKILAFCQTPREREFSYLCYLYPKSHLMT